MGSNLIDQFSYLHFAVGIIMYFWGIKLVLALVLHTIFEIFENTSLGMYIINKYITFWPGGKPYTDNIINSVGDTIFFALGWLSAYGVDNLGSYFGLYKNHIT